MSRVEARQKRRDQGEAETVTPRTRQDRAEPRWPSGNTLAFNEEDPSSTPGPGIRQRLNSQVGRQRTEAAFNSR